MSRSTGLRYPGGRGALWGFIAYIAGFATSAIIVSLYFSRLRSKVTIPLESSSSYPISELITDAHVPLWKWGGFAFYNAHFTDIVFRGIPGQYQTSATSVNILSQAGGPFLLLYLVPPILLVVSGALLTRKATETTELRFDLATGGTRFAFNGGLITLFGYLPLTIIGALLLVANLAGHAGAQADLLKSWVIVGMVYPFVFGGFGGYLRYRSI